MLPSAPLCVPVEISPNASGLAPRVFRLLASVAADRLTLCEPLPAEPDWLRGGLQLRFHLPGDAEAIFCGARARETVIDEGLEHERAGFQALELEALPPEAAARLERYVEERTELST